MKRICILGKGYIGFRLYKYLLKNIKNNHSIDLISLRANDLKDLSKYDVIIDAADKASGVHNSDLGDKLSFIRSDNKLSAIPYIYLSSTTIYENNIGIISEEAKINPTNDYQLNKVNNEKLILKNKSSAAILRLSNIWGIDSPLGTFVGDQINSLRLNHTLEITQKDFKTYIDLVHYRDLSNIIYNIVISNYTKNVLLNICSGYSFRISFLKQKMMSKECIDKLNISNYKNVFSTQKIKTTGLKIPSSFFYYYNKYMRILKK